MRPLIGVTCDYDWDSGKSQLHSGYYEGIFQAGGLPFLIPVLEPFCAADVISRLNGLVLTGGQDVDSYLFGEEPHPKVGKINPYRDELEITLCKEAVAHNIPVLGICRGAQIMNIAMGGTIYQDIETQVNDSELICHDQQAPKWFGIHEVEMRDESNLCEIFGAKVIRTNSFHHQAIRQVGESLFAVAHTRDGIIEAIESKAHSFYIGVQWHPERMLDKDTNTLKLFEAFVKAAEV